MLGLLSTQQRVRKSSGSGASGTLSRSERDGQGDGRKTCHALTSAGVRCKKPPVPGLTVCKTHGGGTGASVRSARRKAAASRVDGLWGIAPEDDGVSVEAELQRLARNKMRDITALRIELGSDPDRYYGLLVESKVHEEFDIIGTVQSKEGSQSKTVRRSGVHPLVEELHKAEQELLSILRLLQEVSGGADDGDIQRIRMQTAREAARLLKAFPGISVDDVAMEVTKRG